MNLDEVRYAFIMSLVTSIEAQEAKVMTHLACGHDEEGDPYEGSTAEAWDVLLLEGMHPIVVGKTPLRCEKQHERSEPC